MKYRTKLLLITFLFAVLCESLFVALLATRVTSGTAQAAANTSSPSHMSMGMYNTTFATQMLPTDGKTVVKLEQIPFTVSKKAQVQVTAMLDLSIGAGESTASSPRIATLSCVLTLDTATLLSFQRNWYNLPVDRTVGLTTTAVTNIGNHILAVTCSGWLIPQYASNGMIIQVGSEGMSTIVA